MGKSSNTSFIHHIRLQFLQPRNLRILVTTDIFSALLLQDGNIDLIAAIRDGNIDLCKHLVELGADVNMQNEVSYLYLIN